MATISAGRRTHLLNIYREVCQYDDLASVPGTPPDEVKRWSYKRDCQLMRLRDQLAYMNREDFLRGRGAAAKQWDAMVERARRDV